MYTCHHREVEYNTKLEELSGQLISVPEPDNSTSYLPSNAAIEQNQFNCSKKEYITKDKFVPEPLTTMK